MASKDPKKAAGTAVAVRSQGTAVDTARPDYLKDYKGPLGSEGIEGQDVTIPRLKIAQAITEEVKAGDLKEGALYLNVTGQAVWKPNDAPLPAIIVAQSKEYILWRPRKDGGGILARAKAVKEKGVTRYRWDKANQSFDVKIDGKTKVTWKTKDFIDQDGLADWGSEIPGDKESGIAATAHHNYVVLLPSLEGMIAAISMSRSQVKKAKDLNAVLKMFKPAYPISAKMFSLSTMDDKNATGDQYKNWAVKPVEADVDAVTFSFADSIKKSFEANGYTVDQSDGGDHGADDPDKAPF